MVDYYILTYIKLHSIYTILGNTTIKTSSWKKERANNDNQMLLDDKGGSIRSLTLILWRNS